jgi:hypothetical protein
MSVGVAIALIGLTSLALAILLVPLLLRRRAGATREAYNLAVDSPADAEWLSLVQRRIAEVAAKLGVNPAT